MALRYCLIAISIWCVCVLLKPTDGRLSSLPSLHPPSGPWTPCGSAWGKANCCRCHDTVADCSGAGLTVIPAFSRPITTLLFGSNILRWLLGSESTFRNVRDLTHLDLSNNSIEVIDIMSFKILKRLKVLDFSRNPFVSGNILPILEIETLEELDLSQTPDSFRVYSTFQFKISRLSQLKVLVLNFYNFQEINMTDFKHMPKLRELQIAGAQCSSLIPDRMPQLEKLIIGGNDLRRIIYSCYDSAVTGPPRWASFFPQLTSLDMSDNIVGHSHPLPFANIMCFPKLTNISLARNFFKRIKTGQFSNERSRYPALQHLFLRSAGSAFTVEHRAFGNPNLLTMDLSQNKLHFASDSVSDSAFAGCTNLFELNLEENVFRGISDFKFQTLFAPLKSLRLLNLAVTGLESIGIGFFKQLKNVTTIHLDTNMISAIPDGAFDDNDQLRILRLDDNLITTIIESTFSSNTRRRLTSLNLSHNPFECTCSLLWFRQWLVSQPELFDLHNPYSRYECSNIPGKHLADFLQNEQPCLLGHDAYVFVVVCSTLLISMLILGLQVYRYRWHIRLVLYEAFRGHPEARQRQRRPEDLQYDLFVSYDSEDERWVNHHLVPVLEQQMGLRLCVHQRDFIPGKNIVDNIQDCLEASKRVLAVFSPNFAESHWCHFELEMCLSHVVDRNDVMVVVILQHVPARDLSGAMSALMNTTTYIEWGGHPETIASFWRRLTIALKDILPACRQ